MSHFVTPGTPSFALSGVLAAGFAGIVKARIKRIEILCIQLFLYRAESFAEALVMNNLSCTKEFDGVCDLRNIPDYPQNIVISAPGFLFA